MQTDKLAGHYFRGKVFCFDCKESTNATNTSFLLSPWFIDVFTWHNHERWVFFRSNDYFPNIYFDKISLCISSSLQLSRSWKMSRDRDGNPPKFYSRLKMRIPESRVVRSRIFYQSVLIRQWELFHACLMFYEAPDSPFQYVISRSYFASRHQLQLRTGKWNECKVRDLKWIWSSPEWSSRDSRLTS